MTRLEQIAREIGVTADYLRSYIRMEISKRTVVEE